jgi:glycine/D-amino acid oxidase-like deaminating enzyme
MGSPAPPANRVLWLEECPPAPRDALPAEVEVAVIGGGLAGLAMALHLQRLGVETVVLERDAPAHGASGRNAGHLLAGTSEYYNRAVELMGREKARAIWAFTVANQQDFTAELLALPQETGFQRSGYLACAATVEERRELEHTVQLLNEDGFAAEFWTAEQLQKRTGRSPFLGARHAPDDGLVHPARVVWALVEAYRAGGGRVASRCEVMALAAGAAGWSLDLRTPEGGRALRASVVVHCTNAWAFRLLPAFRDLILPVRGQMLATTRLHKVIPMAMAANFGYEYWRQAPTGEVLLGGWRWSQRELEIGALSEELNPEIHEGLTSFLQASFPKLQGAELRCAWTGTMGFSRDGLPWIGEVPGSQGQFIAAGFTGHGFGLAWRGTACLAEEIVQGRLREDLRWFRPRRASLPAANA